MPIITHLIVEERGAFVGKHQGRLQVRQGRQVLKQAPLMHLEQVIVTGKAISVSSDAMMACAELGIPVHFVDFRGRPYASMYAAGLTETVQTRRAQLKAFDDERGLQVGLAFARAKLHNQAALLRYMAKYRKTTDPDCYRELRLLSGEVLDPLAKLEKLAKKAQTTEPVRNKLMGLEGQAAKKYWAGVRLAVAVGDDWPGRVGRGATDPANSALNYGYGILYGQVERAIVLAGLDPYAGFVHVDRPGKPSLVLDLIEEFRQPAVDRPVFALLNRGSEVAVDERGLLTADSRQNLLQAVLERLEKPEKYEGKRVPLRNIIQSQARHLATFVRGVRTPYTGFAVKW